MRPKQRALPPMVPWAIWARFGIRGLSENAQAHANEAKRNRLERALEVGLEDTFPASDPVAVIQPRRADEVIE
jgi:hypothetical protein